MTGLKEFRTRSFWWRDNRWGEGLGRRGAAAWKLYTDPGHRDVAPLDTMPERPMGAVAWPQMPDAAVVVDFVNERTGQQEVYRLPDPAHMEAPGAVPYSGYPRKAGDAPHILTCPAGLVWNKEQGAWADRVYEWDRFVWVEDLIAAHPLGRAAYTLLDGLDLRKLTFAASDEAKLRGKQCVLVLDRAWHYIPDLTDGYHNGVRLGSDNVQSTTGLRDFVHLFGIVGQGPESVIAPASNFTPTDEQVAFMKFGATGTNQACVVSMDGQSEPGWFANWAGVHGFIRDSSGNPLYWNGIRIKGNTGAVVERITGRGFGHGYANIPPGETDCLAFNQCDKSLERLCDWDGRGLDGIRRSSSMVGHNSTTNSASYGNTYQYGTAGMKTWWLCTNIFEAFSTTYSTAVGGSNGSGGGRNVEESAGKIRFLYPRVIHRGKWSSETDHPDKSTNAGFFLSVLSSTVESKGRGLDPGADMVLWEPWHLPTDYVATDPKGRLVMSAPANYNAHELGYTDGTSTALTPPLVYVDGQSLLGMTNVRRFSITSDSATRTYPSATELAPAGFIISI